MGKCISAHVEGCLSSNIENEIVVYFYHKAQRPCIYVLGKTRYWILLKFNEINRKLDGFNVKLKQHPQLCDSPYTEKVVVFLIVLIKKSKNEALSMVEL